MRQQKIQGRMHERHLGNKRGIINMVEEIKKKEEGEIKGLLIGHETL